MPQVFISYSRKDLSFVQRLAKDLKAAGLEVWYDLSGLEIGMHWGMEIQEAILKSQYIIIVLSPNSIVSEWVEKEFIYANNHKIKIIPLIHEPCDLPLWSVTLHYVDMQGKNYQSHFGELLKVLGVEARGEANKGVTDAEVAPVQKKATKKAAFSRVRFSPLWVIVPLLLAGVISFAVWGVPPLKAALVTNPTLTATANATQNFTSTMTITTTATRSPTPPPTFTPTAGLSATRPADGMTMIYIPAGKFTMGSNSGAANEQPVHTVNLDAYWIDKTEVTNGMYALCVKAGTCKPSVSNYSGSRYPVESISWDFAVTYCKWAGARLPTEAEWEKAARGTDGRIYPWGNASPTCLLENFFCNLQSHTLPVGSYISGASPYGLLDMAGNVSELVKDWYSATYYSISPANNPQGPSSGTTRVVRGGSYEDVGSATSASSRASIDPGGGMYTGFRCASDTAP